MPYKKSLYYFLDIKFNFELHEVAEIKANRHGEREKLILTLRNMAKTNAGVEVLFRGKSIPELVALLDHPNPKGQGSPNSVRIMASRSVCHKSLLVIMTDNF